MERQEYFLHLNSEESKEYYPSNTGSNFMVYIPGTIQLLGLWKCALTEITFITEFTEQRPQYIYICCDLIEDSFAADSFLRILRRIPIPNTGSVKLVNIFPQNYYIKVARDNIKNLHIYIKDENFNDVSFVMEPVTCTLHLLKYE